MSTNPTITDQPNIVATQSILPSPEVEVDVLEQLANVDQLLCHQILPLSDALSYHRRSLNGTYSIINSIDQQLFSAYEKTDVCVGGNQGEYVVHIFDTNNKEVIRMHRSLGCDCFGRCFICCTGTEHYTYDAVVESPPECVIGYVRRETPTCGGILFECDIIDGLFMKKLQIEEKLAFFKQRFTNIKISAHTKEGLSRIGSVTKQWSGWAREVFTDARDFKIEFEMDLDAKIKATLIAALFLIKNRY